MNNINRSPDDGVRSTSALRHAHLRPARGSTCLAVAGTTPVVLATVQAASASRDMGFDADVPGTSAWSPPTC